MADFLFKILFMPLFMFFLAVVVYVMISAIVCDMTGRCQVSPTETVKPGMQERYKAFCDNMGLYCNAAYPDR